MLNGVDLVSEKERFFRTFQVWPVTQRFDPSLWMQNFRSSEVIFAKRLIDRFCYFPELMVDALLKASIQRFMNITYTTFKADYSSEQNDDGFSRAQLAKIGGNVLRRG